MEYTLHFDPSIYFAFAAFGIYYIAKAVSVIVLPSMIANAVVTVAKTSST